jgi:hypothetical protein
MTGVSALASEIAQAMLPQAQVLVHHDSITALAGASVGQPGVIVIAGTGAVAYGQLADGRSFRSGGWGYLMGDEGSGYDLGIGALRAITQASDGRGTSTCLIEMIPQYFALADCLVGFSGRAGSAGRGCGGAGFTARGGAASGSGGAGGDSTVGSARYGGLYHRRRVPRGRVGAVAVPRGDSRAVSGQHGIRRAVFSPVIGALLLALKAVGSPLDVDTIRRIRDSAPDAAISKQAVENR